MLYHIINGAIAIIGIVALLLITVDCPAERYYWDFHDNQKVLSCPSQVSMHSKNS